MTDRSIIDPSTPVDVVQAKLDTPGVGFDRWWLMVVAVIAMIIILAVSTPDPYGRAVTFVSDGIWVTIGITGISFIITVIIGLFGGLGRLSRNKIIKSISTLYVEFVRGIPLMVQLLFWYFAFPAVIQDLGKKLNYEVGS